MSNEPKVLVIGLDAMDKDLVQKWADEGHLPTFKTLFDQALVGATQYQPFLQAGSVWPNFYFGADASVHGQYDGVRHFDPSTYKFSTYRLADLKLDPIWTVLGDAGKRSVVIDTPYLPLPDRHNGVMVLDWLAHAPHGGGDRLNFTTYPADLREKIEQKYGQDPLGGQMCDFHSPRALHEIKWFRDSLLKRIRMKTEMTRDMITGEEWDFLVTVFSDSHCAGHHCWHLHDDSHVEYDAEIARVVGDPMRDVYIALDQAVKELLDCRDESTTVFVFLSHGFETGYTGTRLLDRILARLHGEHSSLKDSVKRSMRNAWRAAPGPIKKVLKPVRTAARNAVYHQGFLPDRQNRVCFEVFGNERAAGIRINLEGREEQGIVKPGKEYDQLCEQLILDLREVRNDETGEPLVADIGRIKDYYTGANLDSLPDLMVQWNRSQPINIVSSRKIGKIRHPHPTVRTGDHRPAGMLFGLGKDFEPGRLNSVVHDYDLAPTIAARFKLEADQFQGRPVEALCAGVNDSADA